MNTAHAATTLATHELAGLRARIEEPDVIIVTMRGRDYRLTIEPDDPNITNIVYKLWRPGDPRETPVLPPLPENHCAYYASCPACKEQLGNGGKIKGIVLPPDGDYERTQHAAGKEYSAPHLLYHAKCFDGTEPSGPLK